MGFLSELNKTLQIILDLGMSFLLNCFARFWSWILLLAHRARSLLNILPLFHRNQWDSHVQNECRIYNEALCCGLGGSTVGIRDFLLSQQAFEEVGGKGISFLFIESIWMVEIRMSNMSCYFVENINSGNVTNGQEQRNWAESLKWNLRWHQINGVCVVNYSCDKCVVKYANRNTIALYG